jgi:hypothetical protein
MVQLVTQWADTQEGQPHLVFWDTGSQVNLITCKEAQAMGLQALPCSLLNLTGAGKGHCSQAGVRYRVPLEDIGGRVILVNTYGIERIMSPLEGGDMVPMEEAFPEVLTGGLVTAAKEVSLLMGQDNLNLFPTERKRVGNARCTGASLGQDGSPWAGRLRQEAVEATDRQKCAPPCDWSMSGGSWRTVPSRPADRRRVRRVMIHGLQRCA